MTQRKPVDPVDRAHLTGASRPSPPIARYGPGPGCADLVTRYWIPVWSLPAPQRQSTLQYPCCLLVVSNTYARCYGVVRGLSTVVLEGDGWAVGTMLTPAGGYALLGPAVRDLNETFADLGELCGAGGVALTRRIRAAMTPDPTDAARHIRAIEAVEGFLAPALPLDPPGRLLNRLVAWLTDHPEVIRVAELADAFGLTERSLQRLTAERLGLSPKWLIQRRRLHDAVARLKAGSVGLADVAAELGYTDQAHFTHDFRAVSGLTPGEFAADQPRRPRP